MNIVLTSEDVFTAHLIEKGATVKKSAANNAHQEHMGSSRRDKNAKNAK